MSTTRSRAKPSTKRKGPPPHRRRNIGPIAVSAVLIAALAALAVLLLPSTAGPSADGEAKPLAAWKPADYHSLAFSPTDPNTVFFGHHNGLLKSTDGGATWVSVKSERNWDAMSLAIPSGSAVQYVAGHDVFYKSAGGGASWQPVRHNLPGTDIHAFAADPDQPSALYAYVVGFGLYKSEDGGPAWQALPGRLHPSTMGLTVVPGSPKVLLAGTMGAGVLRSEDSGATWAEAGGGFSGRSAMALGAAPASPGLVYAGGEGGLFRSADSARTWQRLNFPGTPGILAVSPGDSRRVVAIDSRGQVLRSQDGGDTWQTIG